MLFSLFNAFARTLCLCPYGINISLFFSENLAEEQRALATLGRTFFIQSQGEKGGSDRVNELLLEAGSHYLQSLDVCDKLIGHLSDRELLEMRSRLYLNLGLVYENQVCLTSAKKFMEKALGILK